MPRSRNKVPAHARHKKIIKQAKGFRNRSKNTYSRFIDGLTKAGIEVDRKVMSDIAIREPEAFGALVKQAKAALA